MHPQAKTEMIKCFVIVLISAALALAICWPLGFRQYYQLALAKMFFFVVGMGLLTRRWPCSGDDSSSTESPDDR